jgi:nitrogen regulatory protein PII
MELLICVINKPELLDDVLAGLLEAGITGCTVIDSQGMGKIISQDIPIFSGFKSLFTGARESNFTIFSVIKEEEEVESAIKVIKEIYGSFGNPNAGILFTLPVNRIEGLASG